MTSTPTLPEQEASGNKNIAPPGADPCGSSWPRSDTAATSVLTTGKGLRNPDRITQRTT